MKARGALVLGSIAAVAHGATLIWYARFLREDVGAGYADVVDVLGFAAAGLFGTAALLALLAPAARRRWSEPPRTGLSPAARAGPRHRSFTGRPQLAHRSGAESES